jgi:catechol 2,3-dioxygenase-like lactoylglutathione lyase family enzyme
VRLHHVQVSCPPGGEDAARRFYADGLGLTEVTKPAELASRGGCWFRDAPLAGSGRSSTQGFPGYDASGAVTAEVHVGVEEPFVPARKAHPALLLDDIAALVVIADRLTRSGHDVSWAEQHTFAGYQRFHARDPHGNRVELLAPDPDPS